MHQAGDLAGAEHAYRETLAADPDCFPALHWLGVILAMQGRLDAAQPLMARAVTVNVDSAQPGNAHSLTNRGATLAALGRSEEAVASCTRALAIAPGLIEALENRGVALAQLGRYAMAVDDFEQVLASHPDRPFLRGQLLHAQMHCCEWKDFAGASA